MSKDIEKKIVARLFQSKEEALLSLEVRKKLEDLIVGEEKNKSDPPSSKEPEDPLLDILKEKALIFSDDSLEYELWRKFSEFPARRDSDLLFWYAVSKCHLYLCLTQLNDKILWECREILLKKNSFFPWRTILDAMMEAVKKKPYDEEWKEKALSQLKVLNELEYVSVKDIQDYISKNTKFDSRILSRIQGHLESLRDFPLLELKIFEKMLLTQSLTNRDLFRILKLAKNLNHKDMGWLAVTILHTRKVLSKRMIKVWEFSGEHRKEYPLLIPKEQDLESCFFDFTEQEKDLVKHCLHVSSFYKAQKTGFLKILSFHKKTSFEKNVDSIFQKLEGVWPRTAYSYKRLLYQDSVEIPPMARILLKNEWCLLLGKLICRAGLHQWYWNIFHLLESFQVHDWVIPQNKAKSTKKGVRHLASLQISSLIALRNLCHDKSSEDIRQLLAIFLCRLSLLIFPTHYLALTSLQAMEMPFHLIKKVENYFLSKQYIEYRSTMGLGHLVSLDELNV